MTTHILIELDHEPFEVTRGSIENLPDWVKAKPTQEGEPLVQELKRQASEWWIYRRDRFLLPRLYGNWNDYLISYRGKTEVWPPEDVAKYLKQNPYEACAKVAEKYEKTNHRTHNEHLAALLIAQAIRQLKQKEIGK